MARLRQPTGPLAAAAALLAVAALLAPQGCAAQPRVLQGASFTLSSTAGSGLTLVEKGSDWEVYADTVTIAGTLDLRGDAGASASVNGGNGGSIKIVARRLLCTASCTIDTSGGNGFDWGNSQAAPFTSFANSAGNRGSNGRAGGSGGRAGTISVHTAQLAAGFTFRAQGGNGGRGEVGGNGAQVATNVGANGANGAGGWGGQVVVLQTEAYTDYAMFTNGGAGAQQTRVGNSFVIDSTATNALCTDAALATSSASSLDQCQMFCVNTPNCIRAVWGSVGSTCAATASCNGNIGFIFGFTTSSINRNGPRPPVPAASTFGGTKLVRMPGFPSTYADGVSFGGAEITPCSRFNDLRSCAVACYKNPACNAWAFNRATAGANCCLKSLTGWNTNTALSSDVGGLIQRGTPLPAAFIWPGWHTNGGDLATNSEAAVLSVEGCAEECRKRAPPANNPTAAGCTTFTFRVPNLCYLKNSVGWRSESDTRLWISGRMSAALTRLDLDPLLSGDTLAASCFYEAGIALSGGELDSSLQSSNPVVNGEAGCCERCQAVRTCQAWTLVSGDRCILFGRTGFTTSRNISAIASGFMVRDAQQQVNAIGSFVYQTSGRTASSAAFARVDMSGATIATVSNVNSTRDCAQQCYTRAATPACGAWTYSNATKACQLKSAAGWDLQGNSTQERVSGLVQSIVPGSDVLGDTPVAFFLTGLNEARRSWFRKDTTASLSQLDFLAALAPTCVSVDNTCTSARTQVKRLSDLIRTGASPTIDSFGSSTIALASSSTRCLQSALSGSPPAITLVDGCSDEDLPRQLFTLDSSGRLLHEQSQLHLYVAVGNTQVLLGNLTTLNLANPNASLWFVDVTGTIRPRHLDTNCLDLSGSSLTIRAIDQTGTSETQLWTVVDRTWTFDYEWTSEEGQSYPCANISNPTGNGGTNAAQTADACKATCAADRNCQVATFGSTPTCTNCCWTKSEPGCAPVDDAGVTSYRKTSVLPTTGVFLLGTTDNPRGRCLSRSPISGRPDVKMDWCLSLPPGDVQEFSYDSSSRIRSSDGRCLTTDAGRRTIGHLPFLASCVPSGTGQQWFYDSAGFFRAAHFSSGLCLKVVDEQLSVASCASSIATAWATRDTCDVAADTWDLVDTEVCKESNGFQGGCPFVRSNLLGVCSDVSGVRYRAGAFVQRLDAWLTNDGDAVGALRLVYSTGTARDVVGDNNLVLARAPDAQLAITSPISEIRMWYSNTVDDDDRPRIGRLYIGLLEDGRALDLGNRTAYPIGSPDMLSALVDLESAPTSPTGLGALFGVYFTTSTPTLGKPTALNTIGLLLPQLPTASAYTIDLPNLVESMIKADPISALALVVDNSKSDREMEVVCPSWERSVTTGFTFSRGREESTLQSTSDTFSVALGLEVGFEAEIPFTGISSEWSVSAETGYEFSYTSETSTTLSFSFEESSEETITISMPSQIFYLGPGEIGTCTGLYAKMVTDLDYVSTLTLNFPADPDTGLTPVYRRSWTGKYRNVNATSGFTGFTRVLASVARAPRPPPARPPPKYVRPVVPTEFVREVVVVTGTASPSMCPRTFTWVEHNLNGPGHSSGLPPLYACYRPALPTEFPNARFIADITTVSGQTEEDCVCPAGFERLSWDLNEGTPGWLIFFCVRYVPRPFGTMLMDFEVSETTTCRGGYVLASTPAQNLNRGISGATPIYLCKRLGASTITALRPFPPPPPPPRTFYQAIPAGNVCVMYSASTSGPLVYTPFSFRTITATTPPQYCQCRTACRNEWGCDAFLLCRAGDNRKDCARAAPYRDTFTGAATCSTLINPWTGTLRAPAVEFTSSLSGVTLAQFNTMRPAYINAVKASMVAAINTPTFVDVTSVSNTVGSAAGRRRLQGVQATGVAVGTVVTFRGSVANERVQAQVRYFETVTLPTLNAFIRSIMKLKTPVQVQRTRTTQTTIVVDKPPVLLSQGAVTASSPIQAGARAASAVVDGRAATCMRTAATARPWVVVDLGAQKAITKVTVANRPAGDPLAADLHHVEVRAWTGAPPLLQPSSSATGFRCGYREAAVPAGGSHTFQCATGGGRQARYVSVRIVAAAPETLAPCEVSVFGPGSA